MRVCVALLLALSWAFAATAVAAAATAAAASADDRTKQRLWDEKLQAESDGGKFLRFDVYKMGSVASGVASDHGGDRGEKSGNYGDRGVAGGENNGSVGGGDHGVAGGGGENNASKSNESARNTDRAHTLLVVGGVHGDEPGGYFAPALLASHYKITKGALWVVPNLNSESIVRTRRGIFGDMNRKFAVVKITDPDYLMVQKIKEIVLDPQVDLVINLHDGHGFYRERWENVIFNPKAWGQTLVIDQNALDNVPFGDMDKIAQVVTERLNKFLESDHHYFTVKNTETRYKDEEMQRSLTYFAVTNHKPAFGQETSKNIDALALKVEYHLRSIEEVMKVMGIEFERDFELNYNGVQKVLNDYGKLTINGKTTLNLIDLRSVLRYVPLRKDGSDVFAFDHPLGAAKRRDDRVDIYIGNKHISSFYPQLFNNDCDLLAAAVTVDSKDRVLDMGTTFAFSEKFNVAKAKNLRVNVIGYFKNGVENEAGINIKKTDLEPRFSEDVRGKIYRVEFYQNDSFCGTLNARIK